MSSGHVSEETNPKAQPTSGIRNDFNRDQERSDDQWNLGWHRMRCQWNLLNGKGNQVQAYKHGESGCESSGNRSGTCLQVWHQTSYVSSGDSNECGSVRICFQINISWSTTYRVQSI